MTRWMMWSATAACLLAAAFFLTWGVQTAWLGSFPDRDHATYSAWALLQFAAALAFAIAPLAIWYLSKRSKRKRSGTASGR
jgi:hypothetical protein